MAAQGTITRRAYARLGLLGNPSDGYGGATLSVAVENFYAEVVLEPGEGVSFVPHPEHDQSAFADLPALARRVQRNGYYGGLRLLWSTCVQFHNFWAARGTPVPTTAARPLGFRMSYSTTIPKQAGLSGSSAIITAALACLQAHYGPAFAVPLPLRPTLALEAERALGITAGLQDRVIQAYEGVVFMDFSPAVVAALGHGEYTRLDPALLPPLWLVWCDNPGDSGAVHSTVRARYDAGDADTVALMAQVGALAHRGRAALEAGDVGGLAALMDANFELRRGLFGDAALGALNVAMVRTAQRCGGGAKFCGSGGAAVALCPGGEEQEARLRAACLEAGFCCERVRVRLPADTL